AAGLVPGRIRKNAAEKRERASAARQPNPTTDQSLQPFFFFKQKTAYEMEMHVDAIKQGDRVVLVDDLIATGGTAEGAVKLLRQLGAQVLAACFIIDLPDLGGADKLRKLEVPVRTLISFEGH